MSEGRNELEKAIEVWERRHVAAVQAKREAEVVMPFLRAAVEELDSFHAGNKTVPAAAPELSAPTPEESVAPSPLGDKLGLAPDDNADEPSGDDAPTKFPKAFKSRGIASLMKNEKTDEKNSDDEAAAV